MASIHQLAVQNNQELNILEDIGQLSKKQTLNLKNAFL